MGRHTHSSRPVRGARIRALLAGALALGIGATATLASWTDTEKAQGAFTTSVFNTESSVDNGASYADNNSGSGATLTFPASGMSPNTVRYANMLVRTKAGSITGTMALSGGTYTPAGSDETTVLGAALRYRVVSTTATCNAAAFSGSPTWVVGPTAQPLSTAGSVTVALAAAGASTPGTASGMCFEVSLPSTADTGLQGRSSTAQWQIVATSS